MRYDLIMTDELFSLNDIKADWSETKEILERCYEKIPNVTKAKQKTCIHLLKEVDENLKLLDRKETDYKSNEGRKDKIEDEMTYIARKAKLTAIEAESTINKYLLKEIYKIGMGEIGILIGISSALVIMYVVHHFTGIGVAERTTRFELWETGIGKGLEIIYWSLFGVMANLMYSAALHLFNRDFDEYSKGWYYAKIFQAPLITLVVVLFFMYTTIDVGDIFTLTLRNASIYILIVVSFIMGFFSRRTYTFMTTIRDKIIKPPEGERVEDNNNP